MKLVTSLAIAILLAGCASITKGTTQSLTIDTPAHPGATCSLTSPEIGTQSVVTPGQIKLDKSKHNIAVSCTKGCLAGTATITSNTESMAIGNVLLGGVIGVGVDSATGALNKYSDPTHVQLHPQQGCKG